MEGIIICILSVFVSFVVGVETCFAIKGRNMGEKPRIELVFSGGRVNGFVHIEVVKVIDSLYIPIDFIVGTSVESIIGSFYAIMQERLCEWGRCWIVK